MRGSEVELLAGSVYIKHGQPGLERQVTSHNLSDIKSVELLIDDNRMYVVRVHFNDGVWVNESQSHIDIKHMGEAAYAACLAGELVRAVNIYRPAEERK